jgi:Skp family chaperone for outer membrane proteins
MAKIVAVPEAELQSIRNRREALENELAKELEIEEEGKKVSELEARIKLEQRKIHPSKLSKFQNVVAELGRTIEKAKEKKLSAVI